MHVKLGKVSLPLSSGVTPLLDPGPWTLLPKPKQSYPLHIPVAAGTCGRSSAGVVASTFYTRRPVAIVVEMEGWEMGGRE